VTYEQNITIYPANAALIFEGFAGILELNAIPKD